MAEVVTGFIFDVTPTGQWLWSCGHCHAKDNPPVELVRKRPTHAACKKCQRINTIHR